MEVTQQELLQIIGEKELKIYLLQKEVAKLKDSEQRLTRQLDDKVKGNKHINPVERFSFLTEKPVVAQENP